MTASESMLGLAQRMQRVDVPFNGGTVAWRSLGQGAPLVLLHGGHGGWAHWARNIEALSQHFAVWVPDMPGYGDSSPPVAPNFDALLHATQATLNTLLGAQTPLLLAGFSFGGLVAAHLAQQRGAVAALALLGPAGHGGPRRPRGVLQAWREAQASGDAAALHAVMRHNLELHMLAGPADDEAVAIHTQLCLHTRFTSRRISMAGGLTTALAALPCPVLLLFGEHDVTATPTELLPTLTTTCAHAQAHIEPSVGHWVQYEAAQAVNARLTQWLLAAAAR